MNMDSMSLAQLMKDMQDPEMMREAQKMMQDPSFQAYMRKITENPAFKQSMDKTKEMMKDPKKVAEMQKIAEAKLAEGEKLLQEAEKAKEGEAMSIEELEAKIATLDVGSEERAKLKKKLKKKKFLKAKKEREQNDIIEDVPEM